MRFELDPASMMFVLGRKQQRNYLIRLSAALHEPVLERTLQKALERAIQKYPYFFVRFVNSQNRLYAEPATRIPAVKQIDNVCSLKLWKGHESCEARVSYSHKTIFLEFFHAISDGKGGLEFLKCLIVEYLSILYPAERILLDVPVILLERQLENGYQKYAEGFRTKKSSGMVFQIKGISAQAEISSYCFSVCEIKQAAKKHNVNITEFMAVLLSFAIAGVQKESCQGNRRKRIRLLIPVNLRTRFPCDTMRNFTLNVNLEASPGEIGDFPTMCRKLQHDMRMAIKPEQLAGQCAAAAGMCDCGIVKRLPISMKKRLVQTGLDFSLSRNSMTFSNMGATLWPEELKIHVEALEMVFSAKPEAPYSCGVISINDNMQLTLLRTIKEPVLERQLERILSDQHINFKIV